MSKNQPSNFSSSQKLGEFELLGELGRGGMGVVYKAYQPSLNRYVALKIIKEGLSTTQNIIQRFKREAEAAARLHHPNIVPIFSIGSEMNLHYYAMELVEGPSLDSVLEAFQSDDFEIQTDEISSETTQDIQPTIDSSSETVAEDLEATTDLQAEPEIVQTPVPISKKPTLSQWVLTELGANDLKKSKKEYFNNIARLIAAVAQGLEYAHQNKIIHRDIKPANLLLAQDGRLCINDFGLARTLEQPSLTQSGEFLGSPMYMAPEQISAGRIPLDHRADIYSLGATLYQLLTFQPPAQGMSRDEVLANLIQKEPIPLRQHESQIPLDLETVCLKAMEKDPDRRYSTAGEFAEDLFRFVDRQPVKARRITPLEKGWRWAKAHKALATTSFLVLLLAVIGLSLFFKNRSEQLLKWQDQARLSTWNNDLDQAEEAINKAISYGASQIWIQKARGQIDLFSGKVEHAIVKIKHAKKLSRNGISERALLATAHFQNGNWWDYRLEMEELDKALKSSSLVSFEDRLYYGWAKIWNDPEEASTILEKATKERFSSPLPRVLHSIALAQLALQRGEPNTAQQALRTVEAAKAFVSRDDGLIEGAELFSLLVLHHLSDEKNNVHLSRADLLFRKKRNIYTLPLKLHWQVHYFLAKKKYREVLSFIEGAAEGDLNVMGFFIWPYLAATYGSQRFSESHRFLECMAKEKPKLRSRIDYDFELVRALTAIATNTSLGREVAEEIYQRLTRNYDIGTLSIESIAVTLLIPTLLGDQEQVKKRATESLNKLKKKLNGEWVWPLHTTEYLAEAISEEELTQMVSLDKSRAQYGESQYWLGMVKLSQSKREDAIQHFKNSVKSKVFNFHGPTLAQALLDLLEKDPNWPSWIKK